MNKIESKWNTTILLQQNVNSLGIILAILSIDSNDVAQIQAKQSDAHNQNCSIGDVDTSRELHRHSYPFYSFTNQITYYRCHCHYNSILCVTSWKKERKKKASLTLLKSILVQPSEQSPRCTSIKMHRADSPHNITVQFTNMKIERFTFEL